MRDGLKFGLRFTLAMTIACVVVIAIIVAATGGPWMMAAAQTLWMVPLMCTAALIALWVTLQ